MLKVLEGFRHREAQRVSGMTARSTEDEEWEYPPVTDALESVGIWWIKKYIQIKKATIMAQMACQTIYEICTGEEWMSGSSRMVRSWDQDGVREEE